jgi:hypothetical protein
VGIWARWFGRAGAGGVSPAGFTPAEEAARLVIQGRARPGLFTSRLRLGTVAGELRLPEGLTCSFLEVMDCPGFEALPAKLWAEGVRIVNCPAFRRMSESAAIDALSLAHCPAFRFPEGLRLGAVSLEHCRPDVLPEELSCQRLIARGAGFRELPPRVRVQQFLDLTGAEFLSVLPDLAVPEIVLAHCRSLTLLPARLEARRLDLSGCTSLGWQAEAWAEVEFLSLRGCRQITELPAWLLVHESIDVAESGLRSLPESHRHCRLFWHGVPVDERIAFRAEELTTREILEQTNAELRRVMIERRGWEVFLGEIHPRVRDQDTDAGGERQLLQVDFPGDEAAVLLCVTCPSTGRRYFLRVPPSTATCHAAAAWIAGFDDPADYEPAEES